MMALRKTAFLRANLLLRAKGGWSQLR